MRELFTHIPEKLDIKSEAITKSELIDGNPLNQAIESKVNSISYKSLPEMLSYFIKVTGIPENLVSEVEQNLLLEVKASRNLLIHNNLKVNQIYKETAGVNIRTPNNNGRLQITQEYLFQSLVIMRNMLQNFRNEILNKYNDYTKIRALKNLFEYIFKTSVLNFDQEFDIDNEADTISSLKTTSSRMNSLSSGERIFFDVWLAHTHGKNFQFTEGMFFRLDGRNIKKMAYLIENLELLKT